MTGKKVEYQELSQDMRLEQLTARIFQVEQELFNAHLNVEMEKIIDDETGSRRSLIEQNETAVVHATKRLARLRELRDEIASPAKAKD